MVRERLFNYCKLDIFSCRSKKVVRNVGITVDTIVVIVGMFKVVSFARHQVTVICRLVSLILPASANLHCFQDGRRISIVTLTRNPQRLSTRSDRRMGREATTGDPRESAISLDAGCRISTWSSQK